ncbi:MAG TPA: hypothetical protein VFW65_15515 [Pseudonocardiaceae bacterium]|nr:hypothetical protein [Pseudonocardiaceae bacterium]
MATVLIVVAMAAVIVHSVDRSAPAASSTAFGSTTLAGTPSPTTAPTTSSSTPPPTSTTPADNPALAKQAVKEVDALQVSGVQYGVAILDRNTGTLTTGAEGDVGFFSASVVKLFVVVDILHRVEQGRLTLSSTDENNIKRALELSDDNAMDALWVKYNGPALVTEMISLAGLHDTVLDKADPGEWGETEISARDVTAVWEYALTHLSTAHTSLVVSDTHSAANNGADGFDQAFGLLEPPRPSTVKAKQGWMIAGSEMILNTTGVLGARNQYVVAILTKQSASIGYPQGRANVNKASVQVLKQLSPGLG